MFDSFGYSMFLSNKTIKRPYSENFISDTKDQNKLKKNSKIFTYFNLDESVVKKPQNCLTTVKCKNCDRTKLMKNELYLIDKDYFCDIDCQMSFVLQNED